MAIKSRILKGSDGTERRVQLGSKAETKYLGQGYTPQSEGATSSRTGEAVVAPISRPIRTEATDTEESQTTQPQTAEQIQREMTAAAQGQINSLREYEQSQLAEQKTINEKNDRSTASVSTLTGLAGSSEANVAQQATTNVGKQANQAIRAEAELKVQALLGNIRQSAVAEARAQREEARMDEEARLANRAARQEEAVTQLTNLTAGGVTYEGLQAGDPESFNYLASQFGGAEALRGAFTLNTPQEQILDKKIVGNNYIISKQNPVTGKVTVETIAIEGLPPQYSQTVDLGGQIMFYDPTDPQGKQFFVSKSLTPSQQITPTPTNDGSMPSYVDLDELGGPDDPMIDLIASTDGGRVLTQSEVKPMTDATRVLNQLGDLTSMISTETGPILGIIRSNNPYDVKSQELQAAVTAIVPQLARGIYGEVGVLTDSDVARYVQTLPNIKSTSDVNKAIMGLTLRNIRSAFVANLEAMAAANRDVSGFTNIYTRLNTQIDSIEGELGISKRSNQSNGKLISPDGTQEVPIADLTPEELEEARNAGWQ